MYSALSFISFNSKFLFFEYIILKKWYLKRVIIINDSKEKFNIYPIKKKLYINAYYEKDDRKFSIFNIHKLYDRAKEEKEESLFQLFNYIKNI